MLTSLEEFKYYQSFRVPVESKDDVMFILEYENDHGKFSFVEKVKLLDVSMSGLGFISPFPMAIGTIVRCSLQFKRNRYEFGGHIVRAFKEQTPAHEEAMNFGIELDEEDFPAMKRFIETYIHSMAPERLKEALVNLALSQKYTSEKEGFEMFSLMLSLFKDITHFGNKEKFVESMLEEIIRILNAQRASIFLINTETNELEAIAALGIEKESLKFDYRKGIAGSVFTTGVSLNIDTKQDKVRFSEEMDKVTGFETKSIICSPISNREDKIIGVIEVLNKRNEDRFTEEDEKTMKVLALILSSVFHNYNPVSERSLIRRFSTPYDREVAWIGRSTHTAEIRRAMVKLKDLDSPVLAHGEPGTGKKLFLRIIHLEGKRGLNPFFIIPCKGVPSEEIEKLVFGTSEAPSKLEEAAGGSIVFDEIGYLSLELQNKLMDIIHCRRLPGSHISLDVRFLFSTSQNLGEMSQESGSFNLDLYNYISSSEVFVEALRKRSADVEDLMGYFLKKECRKQGLLLKEFTPEIREQLKNYPWPGNVMEMEKVIEKAVLYNPKAHIICELGSKAQPIIDLSKINQLEFENIPHAGNSNLPLKDRVTLIEREIILNEIKKHKGNKSKAALSMGISREALRKKLILSDEVLGHVSTEVMPEEIKKAA